MNKNYISQPVYLSNKEAERFWDAAMQIGAKFKERPVSNDWFSQSLKNVNALLRREGKLKDDNQDWKKWSREASRKARENMDKAIREGKLPETY